ncbi:MAG: hypothetical protein ACYTEQ_19070 [Planctomycetota bacterium]
MLYKESLPTKHLAAQREKQIKGFSRKKKETLFAKSSRSLSGAKPGPLLGEFKRNAFLGGLAPSRFPASRVLLVECNAFLYLVGTNLQGMQRCALEH